MNEVRDFYNSPSFWQIMNIALRENSHSTFISYYLNPNNHHSIGDSFLKLFLPMVVNLK
ncbi:MAG: PD-(D/E)XK nuclease family protein [Muribaculaceae bacterium]|nr:PD-(D/E)XK nuclease family protein [Muribaculaceae bacterium]